MNEKDFDKYMRRFEGGGVQQFMPGGGYYEWRKKLAADPEQSDPPPLQAEPVPQPVESIPWEGQMDPRFAATLPEYWFGGHRVPYMSDIGIKSVETWRAWKQAYWAARGIDLKQPSLPSPKIEDLDDDELKRAHQVLDPYGRRLPASFLENIRGQDQQYAEELIGLMNKLMQGYDPHTGRMLVAADVESGRVTFDDWLDANWSSYM